MMRKSMKDAVGNTVKNMLKSGLTVSFSMKELNLLGIEILEVRISPDEIKKIREKTNASQTVFAKLLNVSPSSVRQWEQGKRKPSGSTMVLLELLDKAPNILDYRIETQMNAN